MNHHNNIVRIKAVAKALAELKDRVVFVGGATISLYLDKPVLDVRSTDDIDVIIEILNYAERATLEEKLRSMGFSHDIKSGIVCRYHIQGITVDIMPTDDPSIGFTNQWYPKGFEEAIDHVIDDICIVKILSSPYFIATKFEAHKDRGGDDGRTSQDFEDIVSVLENRSAIWEELGKVEIPVKEYLKNEFRNLLSNPNCYEWIGCHVERIYPPATDSIMRHIKNFIST